MAEQIEEFRDFLAERNQSGRWPDDQLGKALEVAAAQAKFSEDTDAAPGRMMIREDKWLKVWHDEDVLGRQYIRFGIAVGPKTIEISQVET